MEVLNENIPDKVFENVSLHSSLESLDNNKSDDEFPDSTGEEPNEEAKKEKSKFGSLGRRIYTKTNKNPEYASSTIPKREHGQMNLVEGASLDGPPKQKSLTNLRSAVSLYWQSIFSKKKEDREQQAESNPEEDKPKADIIVKENADNSDAGILINNS